MGWGAYGGGGIDWGDALDSTIDAIPRGGKTPWGGSRRGRSHDVVSGQDVERGPAQGPSIWGPGIFNPTPEQRDEARVRDDEYALMQGEGQQESGIFTRPDFDPTAITGPYGDYTAAANQAFDEYRALLEGISTAPRTSRIEEMYGLAIAEANRRGESAD